MRADIEYVPARSIIAAVKPTDDYIYRDYNMNIYRGCCHGCIYCDSRSACYRLDRFDTVRAKKDALELIEKELRSKRRKGIIATGAMSDPYNPYEKELCLTRGALLLIEKYAFGVSVTTKSHSVARDADVLGAISLNAAADVRLTITSFDDALSKKIEPNASAPGERFRALEELSRAGAYTGVFIMPVLPYITDKIVNITGIVRRAADCGAKNIVLAPGMTLRDGNREYYYDAIDRMFPGLKTKYQTCYGDNYYCPADNANELMHAFREECEKRRLAYTFRDINRELKSMMVRQASLFE